MAWYANDEDRRIHQLVANWKETARDAIDEIGGWRDASPEQIATPNALQPYSGLWRLTIELCTFIRKSYPHINPAPLEDVYEAVAIWSNDHDGKILPAQAVLWAKADRAVIVLATIERDIESRITKENPKNKTASTATGHSPDSAPHGYIRTKTILLDEAYKVDGLNPTRTAIEGWEKRHPVETWSDPKSNETYYPPEWVADRMKTYKPQTRKQRA